MIEFDRVSISYVRTKQVFNNWSFSIPCGSVTTILGANGAGKTTLLKCMTGQMKPDEGKITINDRNISGLHTKELAKQISFVPQTIDNTIDYSVQDFIAFGRTPYLGVFEQPSDEDYDFALDCASKSGVSHLAEKRMKELSGGERQLVYIVRALVQETPIIIMDEPMASLDFGNQAVILEKISELSHEGKTVVFTSHNPNHALAISSEVLMINQKKELIQGNADTLLRNENALKETFGERVCYYPSNHQGGFISFVL